MNNTNSPVGRIDVLSLNGEVMESIECSHKEKFLQAIKEKNCYSVMMTIILYRDKSGITIPQDFLKEMNPLPQWVRIEDVPDPEPPFCVIRDGVFYGLFSAQTGKELPCQLLDYDNFSQAEEGSDEYRDYQRLEAIMEKGENDQTEDTQTKKEEVVILPVPQYKLDIIDEFLNLPSGLDEDEYQGDDTIAYSVRFSDGLQADVKCCGCQDEASWAEMVLFDKEGYELCCTEPGEEFAGEWSLEYGDTTYVVVVQAI